jgi:hypothetical protein
MNKGIGNGNKALSEFIHIPTFHTLILQQQLNFA